MANPKTHNGLPQDKTRPRLLPWTHEGKPCWLSAASEGGLLSGMADAIEADQLRDAREVLARARGMLESPDRLGAQELRFVCVRLAESLAEMVRLVTSRGLRLGIDDPDADEPEVEEPPWPWPPGPGTP